MISINPYKPLPKIGAPVTAFSPRGRAELYTSDSSMEATDSNELAAADTADDDISSTVIEQISLSPPPSPPHLSDWSGPTVRVSLKRLAGNIRERATKQYELREMRRMLKRLQQAEAAGVEVQDKDLMQPLWKRLRQNFFKDAAAFGARLKTIAPSEHTVLYLMRPPDDESALKPAQMVQIFWSTLAIELLVCVVQFDNSANVREADIELYRARSYDESQFDGTENQEVLSPFVFSPLTALIQGVISAVVCLFVIALCSYVFRLGSTRRKLPAGLVRLFVRLAELYRKLRRGYRLGMQMVGIGKGLTKADQSELAQMAAKAEAALFAAKQESRDAAKELATEFGVKYEETRQLTRLGWLIMIVGCFVCPGLNFVIAMCCCRKKGRRAVYGDTEDNSEDSDGNQRVEVVIPVGTVTGDDFTFEHNGANFLMTVPDGYAGGDAIWVTPPAAYVAPKKRMQGGLARVKRAMKALHSIDELVQESKAPPPPPPKKTVPKLDQRGADEVLGRIVSYGWESQIRWEKAVSTVQRIYRARRVQRDFAQRLNKRLAARRRLTRMKMGVRFGMALKPPPRDLAADLGKRSDEKIQHVVQILKNELKEKSARIAELFKELDESGTGYVTRQQWIKGFAKMGMHTPPGRHLAYSPFTNSCSGQNYRRTYQSRF